MKEYTGREEEEKTVREHDSGGSKGGNGICLRGENTYNLCRLLNPFVPRFPLIKGRGDNCTYFIVLAE